MNPKTIQSYGGVYTDSEAVSNPTTEQSADLGNRVFEDTAQLTRVTRRVLCKFATSTTASLPASISVVSASRTVWGSGAGQYPTISKTAIGTYVITYASEYDDALVGTSSDAVSETENVNFTFSSASVKGSTFGTAQTSESSNVITVYVFDGSSPPALSDLSGGVEIQVEGS